MMLDVRYRIATLVKVLEGAESHGDSLCPILVFHSSNETTLCVL